MQDFTCNMPKIVFGSGKIKELGGFAGDFGSRAFLAVDPFLHSQGFTDEIAGSLKEHGVDSFPFSDIEPNPSCFDVDKAGELARSGKCDFVLAVGGGSAIDFGKGVAVVAGNPETSWRYTRRKDHTPLTPGETTLPVIAVPTTAGTGSETTHFSVLSNPELKEKSTIAHERIFPKLALIDPELTYTMPSKLTALTGIDVLAHAVESFINVKATPYSKMMSIEAVRLTAEYLPRAAANGGNTAARANMSWASTLAGIAIAHSNPTLPHALGQAAGGFIHAPHGGSVAACLTEIMKISYMADLEGFAEIAVAMDPSTSGLPLYDRAEKSVELVERLFRDIGGTVRFGDFGLKEEDIERVTDIAMTGYFTGISLHPKVVDKNEIMRIYRACL